jgi:hypothetical protein
MLQNMIPQVTNAAKQDQVRSGPMSKVQLKAMHIFIGGHRITESSGYIVLAIPALYKNCNGSIVPVACPHKKIEMVT